MPMNAGTHHPFTVFCVINSSPEFSRSGPPRRHARKLSNRISPAVLLAATGVGLLMYGLMSGLEAFRKPSTQVNAPV